jgi:chorismate mutase
MTMMMRGVRGATIAESNSAEAILSATTELLEKLIEANGIEEDQVASVIFSLTQDLTTVFPAQAARQMGWHRVALLGCQEANIEGGMERCVRILIHWNTTKPLNEIRHVYLRDSVRLRPDLYPDNKIVVNGSK